MNEEDEMILNWMDCTNIADFLYPVCKIFHSSSILLIIQLLNLMRVWYGDSMHMNVWTNKRGGMFLKQSFFTMIENGI